ncbi:hypothetical protein [Paraburkholderia unamae]|uniref:Uncharacterized protein n=1 Tax=Paraburkholderia unamae TaxID=219649 RepID=A0ABX5KFN1_9BURK|nr:hypothetical protein [Paraburkholderia unamae]PVX77191.1 hypothetical protein C7402_115250 [Paraburkholderia unamae]
MTDAEREERIRDLGQQINESWEPDELRSLWTEMRGLIMQRSQAQIHAMEVAQGLK